MKKIIIVKERKCFQDMKCIEMQYLHAIFFNSNIILILKFEYFGKPFRMKFK
jgi:hypothetical protein